MPAHLRQSVNFLFAVSILFSVLTLITFNVQTISISKRVLGAQTVAVRAAEKERGFWLNFLDENPTYLEGWVELAVLEYNEGNMEAADEYYLKAKSIDPNSDKLPW